MDLYYDAFRLNMKYYRECEKISQMQLAILCDCSNGTIGSIEAGKAKPSFDLILRIAKSLKIHPADLFLRSASETRGKIKQQLKIHLSEDLNKIIDKNFPD